MNPDNTLPPNNSYFPDQVQVGRPSVYLDPSVSSQGPANAVPDVTVPQNWLLYPNGSNQPPRMFSNPGSQWKLLISDPTLRVVTENAGSVSPSSVRYDRRWLSHLSEIPLSLGQGYMKSIVPDDAIVREDHPTVVHNLDTRGPPPNSRYYSWWNSPPPFDVNQRLSSNDLVQLVEIHNGTHRSVKRDHLESAAFVLPLFLREDLYSSLFCEIHCTLGGGDGPSLEDWVEDIILSKVSTIFLIENFLLEMLRFISSIGVNSFPPLVDFIHDFQDILWSLLESNIIQLDQLDEHLKFDQVTWWSERDSFVQRWRSRWNVPELDSPTIRRNYICGTIDAMFGLWPAPGHCFLHDWGQKHEAGGCDADDEFRIQDLDPVDRWVSERDAEPRCINSGLYFWETLPPEPDIGNFETTAEDLEKGASVSLTDLDARLINQRVPFKFSRTNRLDLHLTITDNQHILIFPYWKRLLMLRHHRVLVDDSCAEYPLGTVSLFQLLSRSARSADSRRKGIGGDVRYIAYELLQTYALLFYRHISCDSNCPDRRARGPGFYYREARLGISGWFGWSGMSSEDIAKGIGLEISYSKESFGALMPELWEHDYVPQSRDFKIFGKRLESINKELNVWRPSDLAELVRYRGWVEEESNYWAFWAVVGALIFAFLTLILGGLQLYYAIHPNSPGSS